MSTLPQVPPVLDALPVSLEIVAPASPMVLADTKFVATLTRVEREIALLVVDDAQSAQFAADLKQRLTTAGTDLDKARKEKIAPYLDAQRRINAAAEPISARITDAKAKLNSQLVAFAEKQRRDAEELERQRQAEIARLEKIRLAEEAEKARKAKEIADAAAEVQRKADEAERARLAKLSADARAAEQAKMAELPPEEDPAPLAPIAPPEKTETQQKIDALKFAPAVVIAAPVGIRMLVTLKHEVVDVSKLPEPFVLRTAKDAAIRQTFCVGWTEGQPLPVCPGVTFRIDRQAPSTGRNRF